MRAYVELERALRAGDLDAARAVFADDDRFPNVRDPYTAQWILALALRLVAGAATSTSSSSGRIRTSPRTTAFHDSSR